MAISLSPIGGAASQFFNGNGVPLSGGKIFTYGAGTTTPKATFTEANGLTAHSNPIILDSQGRVPGGEIWLTSGQAYLFILKSSVNALIGTWDNIYGYSAGAENAVTEVKIATTGQTDFLLTSMVYTPGTNTLQVYIDGVNQVVNNAYTEVSSTLVTFVSPLHVGAVVKFIQINSAATDAVLVIYLPGGVSAVPTTVQAKLRESVSVMDFGAIPNVAADQTAKFHAAMAALVNGGTLLIPAGTYHVNLVSTKMVTLQGAGSHVSILESFTPAGVVILNACTFTGSWESQLTINDVQLKGPDGSFTAIGIQQGLTAYSTSQEFAGRVQCNRVYFVYLDIGMKKLWGNIGNTFNRCTFELLNFAMHATAKTGAMHAGNDYFQDMCEFAVIYKAVFYYNSGNSGTGGVSVDETCVIQFNPGFVWFVANFNDNDFAPPIMCSGWNEGNHTGTNITIDNVLYPVAVWGHFENATSVCLRDTIATTFTLINSTVVLDKCHYALTYAVTKDADSAIYSVNANLYNGLVPETIQNIAVMSGPLGGQKGGVSIRHPTAVTYEHSAKILYSETFSNNLVTFVGTNTLVTTDQSDGPIFPKSQELTVTSVQTEYTGVVAPSLGSYFVTTLTVRLVSGLPVQINCSKVGTTGIYTVLNSTTWKTFAFYGKVTSAAEVALWVAPPTSGTTVLRFGGCQILQFGNLQDSVDFINAGLFAVDRVILPKVFYGATPPVTGIWGVGDRCINNSPSVSNPKSWVYSTLNVWVSEGNL